jgi:hypothetical protein
MPPPCSFHNKDGGCRKAAENCNHPHVLYCTNSVCVDANKHKTHTFADCGRIGGGSHEAYIAKMKTAAVEKKTVEKTEADRVARSKMCDDLYYKIYELLPKELVLSARKKWGFNLIGKIVGMFYEGFPLEDLAAVANSNDKIELQQHIDDALVSIKKFHGPMD